VGHGVDIVWSMKFLCSAGTNGGAEQFVEQGFCNVIKDLQCFVPLFHKISHRGLGKAKEVKSFKLFSECKTKFSFSPSSSKNTGTLEHSPFSPLLLLLYILYIIYKSKTYNTHTPPKNLVPRSISKVKPSGTLEHQPNQ